jgi:SnoaL-like domain
VIDDRTALDLQSDLPAVWKLLGDYGRLIDGREPEAWSRLFAQDGILAVGDREIRGQSELAAFASASPIGIHLQAVPSIEQEPDGTIRVASNFLFANAATGGIVAGMYQDEIVITGGRPVFARRDIDTRVRG